MSERCGAELAGGYRCEFSGAKEHTHGLDPMRGAISDACKAIEDFFADGDAKSKRRLMSALDALVFILKTWEPR